MRAAAAPAVTRARPLTTTLRSRAHVPSHIPSQYCGHTHAPSHYHCGHARTSPHMNSATIATTRASPPISCRLVTPVRTHRTAFRVHPAQARSRFDVPPHTPFDSERGRDGAARVVRLNPRPDTAARFSGVDAPHGADRLSGSGGAAGVRCRLAAALFHPGGDGAWAAASPLWA
jgi:hypothetical protein